MSTPLNGKRVFLGVTGSVACYKAVTLASLVSQQGASVDVVMTQAATRFVSPLTFQSVTGRHCFTDEDLWGAEAHVLHVGLGRDADLLVVAPATANTMARLANGQADNLLMLTLLTAGTGPAAPPLLLAPAMDGDMWQHQATQRNLARLVKDGANIMGPETGHLASGMVAKGRLSEPELIAGQIRYMLSRAGALKGHKIVVTAGGTREPIDPVRAVTNNSSGKQGVALAEAALDAGADVTLIAPSLSVQLPHGITWVEVLTAREMLDAVLDACHDADVLLMAAAVADFRPASTADQKIKKEYGPPTIQLERNPDILESVFAWRQQSGKELLVIGFAAETENLIENARKKLENKGLAMIVANDVSATDAGFGVDTNRVVLLKRSGKPTSLPLMPKRAVADVVIEYVMDQFGVLQADL